MPAILYTFTKVAFGIYNLSPSSFEKFSRLLILYNIFINLLEGYYEFSSIRKF
jgi:hypothetical protein